MKLKIVFYLVALCASLALCQKPGCGSLPDQRDPALAERANEIFEPLSAEEIQRVIDYLMGQKRLNLKPAQNATFDTNYIYSIENFVPPKEEVIRWLDTKRSRKPDRMAQVFLFMGETQQVKDLLVGPLPRPRFHRENEVNRQNEIAWRARPLTTFEATALQDSLFAQLQPLNAILDKMTADYCDDFWSCVSPSFDPRTSLDFLPRQFIALFPMSQLLVTGYYIFPLPLEMIVYFNETNDVNIREIDYNGESYDSVESLLSDLNANPDKQVLLPPLNDELSKFGSPDFIEEDDTADDTRRPKAEFDPDGQRFRVDGQHVEWLKWSFDLHTRTLSGQQMFDVRFSGERIAYELSLQDITVYYSGPGTNSFFRNFLDNSWGAGRLTTSLVRGVDCPEGAQYFDLSAYATEADSIGVIQDAVCIFEHRNSVPLRRHYSTDGQGSYYFAFSMPDSVLIVRQIMTIYNYDYIYDFELHQNGVIEAMVSSTGYLQVANNIAPGEKKYGLLLEPSWKNVGLFHQHLFNFRFDLDVGGTCNRFKKINFEIEPFQTPYANGEPWYVPVSGESLVECEQSSKVKYNFSRPKQYVVYEGCGDESEKARGYRVSTNSFSKLLIPEESPLIEGALSWSKYQLAVTRYHDSERGTASYFTQGDPFNPDINFEEFFANNEGIVDEDLVIWLTLGMYHLPTNEDLPVTTTPGKTLRASLTPFNYFVRDPSVKSRDGAVFYKAVGSGNDYLHFGNTCDAAVNEPFLQG